MHAVRKESSTTIYKIRAVFDVSAKSASGVFMNDTLLVGPIVHSPLVDVLFCFQFHRLAVTTDVSKMYCAIELIEPDRDFHRFVRRQTPGMTRVTFGISASAFAANMSVKQNNVDFAFEYPQAAETVKRYFYVDDDLTGDDTADEAIKLQTQLQGLFSKGGFLLYKVEFK